ncbi:MAG: hypothetical protein K6G01_08735 [Eubacterium sp.]|nr:hypothetical protein [Eubacterium sp.]
MFRKKTKIAVVILLAVAVCIYLLQMFLFKEPRTTFFYLLQDLAFIPISIAVTTIVVGEVIGQRDKRESERKTRMLTSTFFTAMGMDLTESMKHMVVVDQELEDVVENRCTMNLEQRLAFIEHKHVAMQAKKECFDEVKKLICGWETELLVISSNPLLLEHEDFSRLLFAIFHLIDEFRIRGDYDLLTQEDLRHYNEDFETTYKLLLKNMITNVRYQKQTYPNLYGTVRKRYENSN